MKPNLNHIVFRALLPAVLIFATACEKVLDIKLNNAAPKIVIEANVSDQPGPYQISLTSTVSFSDPNVFPGVTGAQVTLSDNAGNSETLTETEPGIYKTTTFQGVPGRNYFLKVVASGVEYSGVSGMSQPVPLQSIVVENFEFDQTEKVVTIKFQDQAGVKNYYRGLYIVNGKVSDRLFFLDDQFSDGKLIDGTFLDGDMPLESGDTVKVVLQAIDEKMLQYLREEDMLSGQSASPTNPTNNLSNGAMGYFSAHGETSGTVVVP
jgi:hypothetical protein